MKINERQLMRLENITNRKITNDTMLKLALEDMMDKYESDNKNKKSKVVVSSIKKHEYNPTLVLSKYRFNRYPNGIIVCSSISYTIKEYVNMIDNIVVNNIDRFINGSLKPSIFTDRINNINKDLLENIGFKIELYYTRENRKMRKSDFVYSVVDLVQCNTITYCIDNIIVTCNKNIDKNILDDFSKIISSKKDITFTKMYYKFIKNNRCSLHAKGHNKYELIKHDDMIMNIKPNRESVIKENDESKYPYLYNNGKSLSKIDYDPVININSLPACRYNDEEFNYNGDSYTKEEFINYINKRVKSIVDRRSLYSINTEIEIYLLNRLLLQYGLKVVILFSDDINGYDIIDLCKDDYIKYNFKNFNNIKCNRKIPKHVLNWYFDLISREPHLYDKKININYKDGEYKVYLLHNHLTIDIDNSEQ